MAMLNTKEMIKRLIKLIGIRGLKPDQPTLYKSQDVPSDFDPLFSWLVNERHRNACFPTTGLC